MDPAVSSTMLQPPSTSSEATLVLRPSQIRFSQIKVPMFFGNGWKSLVGTFADILSGKIDITSIPMISVFLRDGQYWVYDGDRRLRVYKELEKYAIITAVTVLLVRAPNAYFDVSWTLTNKRSKGLKLYIAYQHKACNWPIEFKFALAYVRHRLLNPIFGIVAVIYLCYVALFLIKEFGSIMASHK